MCGGKSVFMRGDGLPVQGSALGKEGRKYGVDMGGKLPFYARNNSAETDDGRCRYGEKLPFYARKKLIIFH